MVFIRPSCLRCVSEKLTFYKCCLKSVVLINNFFFPTRSRQSLKVREHSVYGPYVDGLSKLAVASYKVRIDVLKGFC